MTFPIYIKRGWIQVILSPEKRFDNPDTFQEINPVELMSCWDTVKNIVERIVYEQIDRSKSVVEQNAKTMTVIDIYNGLSKKNIVDETALLKEVLKTGNFSEDEAKSLIKKVKEEKLDGGMGWY